MDKKNTSSVAQIEDIFIETAADLAESISINPIVGQLYALLYIRPAPVSLDEMVEKLKISKGNASINIRVLENWQAVKKVLVKGTRKDYYTAETDFLKIAAVRLREGMMRRLNTVTDSWEKIKQLANKENDYQEEKKETVEFYKQRLREIEKIHVLAQQLLEIMPLFDSLNQRSYLAKLLVSGMKALKTK